MKSGKAYAHFYLLRTVILALAMVTLFAYTAYAENADSWQDICDIIENNSTANITLTKDIQTDSSRHLHISSGKSVTIDLNGHTITRTGNISTLFNVQGSLTIQDSAAVAVSRQDVNPVSRDQDPRDGTGIGMPASFSGNTLTYYETKSTPSGTGTTEKRQKVTVTVAGQIISINHSNSPLISVSDNGTLTVEGGFFHNPTGRAVQSNGKATMTFTGGYFYGNTIQDRGGAVHANCWDNNAASITIGGHAQKEVVFAGNSAYTGGALATNGPCNVTIKNNAVFSGNYAFGDGRDGGGAIFLGWSSHGVMEGGLVTHNWGTANIVGSNADSSSYDAGGGGILVQGSLKMTGGQVTSNEAAGGGGISTYFWDGGAFSMTGGIVAGNVARLNEGGGITINLNGSANITGGYITNNKTETTQHWGGGGLFASDHSAVTMQSVLITANQASGFGGGLAGCSTGRIDTHAINIREHSVALYGNAAAGTQLSGDSSTKSEDRIYAANDPVFTRDQGAHYKDYFCALNTTVCGSMLGGGLADWSGTADGAAINQGTIGANEKITSQYVTGLTAHPDASAIQAATNNMKVVISGNTSGTHGGGVLCNGYLIIGTQRTMEIGDRMTISGDKTLSGAQLTDDQFTFLVEDADGNIITTGKSKSNSEIQFAGRLSFDKAGTYTYYIRESSEGIPAGVIKDDTRYQMVVRVQDSYQTVDVATSDPAQKEQINVTFHQIHQVDIYKSQNGGSMNIVAQYTNIHSEDKNAYALPYVFEFVNRKSVDTGILVSKTVHDLTRASHSSATFDFTLELSDKTLNGAYGQMNFTNGTAKFSLHAGESKRAVGLPANIRYTVTESPKAGYYNHTPSHSGTIVPNEVKSVVFENHAVGSLKISKTVRGVTQRDNDHLFDFKLTLLPSDGINGNYQGVVFENGVAYFELKHGQEITISTLPAGLHYTVEELPATGYTAERSFHSGTISMGAASQADFVNTRNTGALHVKKNVVNGNDPDHEFQFTVELIDGQHINGDFGDMRFVNGRAVFGLKSGETKRATGIPTGLHYRVKETHDPDYTTHVVGDSNGMIGDSPSVVEYINTRVASDTTSLVIGKETTGTAEDHARSFPFRLTISHETKTLDDEYSGMRFTSGVANFNLKSGESVAIEGLPAGTHYILEELDPDTGRYIVRINGVETNRVEGDIAGTSHAHLDVLNTRRIGSLELSKKTTSTLSYDLNRPFTFTVKVSEPINGRFGDMTFTDGVAMVHLAHGHKATANNLPAGMTYEVTEMPDPDFEVKGTGTTGTIKSEQTSSVFYTNARRLGGLKIIKSIQNGQPDSNDEFGFELVLDHEINGQFGDLIFDKGVAVFTLKGNRPVSVTGLPANLVFTLYETTYDSTRYTPVVNGLSSNIREGEVLEVRFVNQMLISKCGELSVHKAITGSNADMSQKFRFAVTLGDTRINGVYGDMTFVNGVATFDLGHNQQLTATGLPAGITYLVEEMDPKGYSVTSTNERGVIAGNVTARVSFVNHRDFPRVPKTGDSFQLAALLLLAGMSGAGMAALLLIRKRKEQ